MKVRHSCRVVLVDRLDRTLLLRIADDGRLKVPGESPAPPTYWITPGGGSEPGETPEDTARRELFEETGIEAFELGPFLWERRNTVRLDGRPMRFAERFFAGYVDEAVAVLDHLVPEEEGVIVEHRWWTVDELTDERRVDTIFPPEIADLVARAIAARPSGPT